MSQQVFTLFIAAKVRYMYFHLLKLRQCLLTMIEVVLLFTQIQELSEVYIAPSIFRSLSASMLPCTSAPGVLDHCCGEGVYTTSAFFNVFQYVLYILVALHAWLTLTSVGKLCDEVRMNIAVCILTYHINHSFKKRCNWFKEMLPA